MEVERLGCTKTWWHRLFGTILGRIVTDAYLAYKLEQSELHMGVDEVDFTTLIGQLAYQSGC